MLIRILDILSSILILLGLWNSVKDRRWWIVYTCGSIPFIIVCINKNLVGLTVFGFITLVIGIKNYIVGGRRNGI